MPKHDLQLISESNLMLGYACEQGHLAFVKFLCKNMTVNPMCPQKISRFTSSSALARCATEKKYEIFDYLIKRYTKTITENLQVYKSQLQQCVDILTKNKQTSRAKTISDILSKSNMSNRAVTPTEILVVVPELVPHAENIVENNNEPAVDHPHSKDECL